MVSSFHNPSVLSGIRLVRHLYCFSTRYRFRSGTLNYNGINFAFRELQENEIDIYRTSALATLQGAKDTHYTEVRMRALFAVVPFEGGRQDAFPSASVHSVQSEHEPTLARIYPSELLAGDGGVYVGETGCGVADEETNSSGKSQ